MRYSIYSSKTRGIALVQLLVGVAIIAIIVAMAVTAINTSITNSEHRAAEADARVFNDAKVRARLNDDSNPVLDGFDTAGAVHHLMGEGYVR